MKKAVREIFEHDNIERCELIYKQMSGLFGEKNGPPLIDKNKLLGAFFSGGKIAIPEIDFMLTNACTLKCRECLSLMPFYNKKNIFFETQRSFIKRLDLLLKNISYVFRMNITGGEPLLVKDIERIIDYAAQNNQIHYISLITNCTIYPKDRLLSTLEKYRNKIYVVLSEYIDGGGKLKDIYNILTYHNIPVYIANYDWYERGIIKREEREKSRLEEIRRNCRPHFVKVYCEGKLYPCTTSVGIKYCIDNKINDCIDLENESRGINENIIKLFTSPYFNSCSFCHHDDEKQIRRGVQFTDEAEISQTLKKWIEE